MTVNAPRLRLVARRRTTQKAPRSNPTAIAALAVALGALLEYFLDPGAGRRRRHSARDRVLSKLRRGERRAVIRARRAESRTVGIVRRTLNARHASKPPADDVALAHKVESELFRRARVSKGRSTSTPRTAQCSCAGSSKGMRTSRTSAASRRASPACAAWRTCSTSPARRRRPAGRSSFGTEPANREFRESRMRNRSLVNRSTSSLPARRIR